LNRIDITASSSVRFESAFRSDRFHAIDPLAKTAPIDEAQMLSTAWRAIAALAIIGASTTALAQRIPNTDMPGRERERFTDPAPPLAQPGPMFSPPGAIYAPRIAKRRPRKARTSRK
jgi:hypothetical protein